MTTIEAEGLSKRYGARTALDGFHLRAAAGDIVGLLGPNGAGKTTVIRILTTVLAPTAGGFAIAGIPHTRPGAIRARIGVLPESTGYRGRETGLETLSVHGRLFGLDRDAAVRAARRALAEVGLAERAGTPVGTYSRGMRQRLGIARALLNEPAVVFLDEPSLGLDPAGQREVSALIRRIAAERGTTVLLSTHSLPDVEDLCRRVLILSLGRVLASGTVDEVTAMAAAPRTARIRVPSRTAERAAGVLQRIHPDAGLDPARPDTVTVRLPGATTGLNAILRALVDADIDVVGLDIDAPRLSDAFMHLTAAGAV
ncbi:ABC transporter ATP-binding protein [Actinoplanes sp. NPDC051513]|uniref:ABC transporter ATP-binding protein n=1 Tax=Actinoplanes sp. NPDC051513 TaxID=3363908 RepID=UPI0037A6A6A7